MESKEMVIKDIISEIDKEELLLPDFQRDFDWDTEQQKNLIASFLYDIPIGSILILETRESQSMVTKSIGYKKPNSNKDTKAQRYLMDGQQRLTTIKGIFDDLFKKDEKEAFENLYDSLKKRWFLKLKIINENKINKSTLRIVLDLIANDDGIGDDRSLSDIKDLIDHKKINKNQKNELHPEIIKRDKQDFVAYLTKNECLAFFLILPLTAKSTAESSKYKGILKESAKNIFKDKWFGEIKHCSEKEKKEFITILKEYGINIDIDSSNEIEKISDHWAEEMYQTLRHLFTAKRKLFVLTYKESFSKAVEAFTAMNTGGVPLSTFDIIVAKYAALGKNQLLKERIEEQFRKLCKEKFQHLPEINTSKIFNNFLGEKNKTESRKFYNLYLNMLGIFSVASQDVPSDCIKEKHKLSLTKNDIDSFTDPAIESIVMAFRFLSGYCGISSMKDISYELMVIPIAKTLHDKYQKNNELKKNDIFKILYWYWNSIFSGRYREKQNSRSIEDVKNECSSTGLEKIFNDQGYSNFDSLKNGEFISLKNPVLQFILANSILDDKLSNPHNLVEKLETVTYEKAHLISISDYRIKTGEKVARKKSHFINSSLNLALMSKEDNQRDSTKSCYFWNKEVFEKNNILIPRKVNNISWDEFTIQAKDASKEKWDKLCEKFIESRFDELKKTAENTLQYLKENSE